MTATLSQTTLHAQVELPSPVYGAASTYVPVDSWIYTALDELDTTGITQTSMRGLRPWTRQECARLLVEIHENRNPGFPNPRQAVLFALLDQEFRGEQLDRSMPHMGLQLESAYHRITSISGPPLNDGFHFTQTLPNEQGRAFAAGANTFTGVKIRAAVGPFAAQAHVELQHVPAAPAFSNTVEQAIAMADFTTKGALGPATGYLRGRLIEGSVSYAFRGNQLTLGKQTLLWGPARSGATLFSTNAEPINMLRLDRTTPLTPRWAFRYLGQIRGQLLFGRLSGAQFAHTRMITFGTPGKSLPDQPFIHGEKLSFKPTENFEFGVARTVLFAGQGAPLTTASFVRSFFSVGTGDEDHDPGDRRISVDMSYRIPGLRKYATGYFDGFAEDQAFPLLYPTQSTWISGIELHNLPSVKPLTLRAEGQLSPHRNLAFPGFFYFNVHFLSGYTNNLQLIGSWIGRESQSEQLWTTWRFSTRNTAELSLRHQTVAAEFLRGGSLTDVRSTFEYWIGHDWQLHIDTQIERWFFPLLNGTPQHNTAVTVQLSYIPLGGRKL